jgi:hypothetical protein
MPGPKPPVVGMPPLKETDGPFDTAAVVVDLPGSASKFGFTWPSEPSPSGHSQTEDSDATPTDQEVGATSPKFPGLSRAYSMPSQLGHLQNPCRDLSFTPSPPEHSTEFIQFCELSLELAASVQMVVQTLLQVTPAQMLDPAREQFSACSFPFPAPSMSAVLTSLKSLNYMSANMAAYCMETIDSQRAGNRCLGFSLGSSGDANDFDIGELLQSVGDALSGAAANAGVDLVLFHGDVGIKHVSVKGDERGLSIALSHVSANRGPAPLFPHVCTDNQANHQHGSAWRLDRDRLAHLAELPKTWYANYLWHPSVVRLASSMHLRHIA